MDLNVRAYRLVQRATEKAEHPADKKKVASARKGGLKGGRMRAMTLTEERRREIATTASNARWKRRPEPAPTATPTVTNSRLTGTHE